MIIRSEKSSDKEAVRTVNAAAFPSDAEATLVDRLRDQATPFISLVAEDAGEIVGHIVFSPITLDEKPSLEMLGLGPMAVTPARQRQGIGSAMVEAGLAVCRDAAVPAVVVLGHPGFYPRFGFVPASRYGMRSDYDVPDDVFMILELNEGSLDGLSGLVHYHEAFSLM